MVNFAEQMGTEHVPRNGNTLFTKTWGTNGTGTKTSGNKRNGNTKFTKLLERNGTGTQI